MTNQEIIKALRCSANADCKCIKDQCPFFVREDIPEELREKCGGTKTWDSCDVDGIALAAADRLAYYEDMEEQGRLVVLPCKLEAEIFRLGVKEVCAHWQVAYAEVFPDEIVMIDDSDNVFTEEDIGKTVFLTREQAEEALKERD